jgi:signal transduction histidine kinase
VLFRSQGAARYSALGRLAGGVAHEIRNPLNAISIAAQRLARKYPDPMMGVVREEIRRLNDILEEFLTVARRRELALRPGDLCAAAEDVAALMAEAAANGDVSIETTWSLNPCPAVLDPDRMKQAILNLVKNALEATPPGGTVRLATRERGRNRVALMVSDTGAGIEPAHADRVFDLDFTTKERGVGLGLPLAHEIIRGHGGELRLVETSSKGTFFEIVLPRVKKGGETNAHSHR